MVNLSQLGGTSGGVWTRSQAVALIGVVGVRNALRAGTWQTVWPGTYADAGFDLDSEQLCWAAILASGGAGQPFATQRDPTTGLHWPQLRAVASGRTAARWWRLPLIDDADPATGRREHRFDDVGVDRHLPVLRCGGRVLHRRRHVLGPGDLTVTGSGAHVTSLLRTLIDLSGLLTAEAAVCALDDALHRELVTTDELRGAVLARAGRPGSISLAAAVEDADGRAESPAETLTRLLLLPVLPGLEPQVQLKDPRGSIVARFDLGDRSRKLAVESDGKAGHSGAAMVAKDRRRDARSEAYGWWTERVTWYDVRQRQAETKARVMSRAARLDARHAA